MSNVTPLPGAEDVQAERDRLAEEEAERDAETQDESAEERARTIEELAEDEREAEEPEQISLFGTSDQIKANVAGKRPTESHVKIKNRGEKIQGQFDPNDIIELLVRVRCDKIEFAYVRDSDGDVMTSKRIHHLTPLHAERMDDVGGLAAHLITKAGGIQAALEAIRLYEEDAA